MILTGKEIEKRISKGQIVITPYNPHQMNPNSYNLRLHPVMGIYEKDTLDARKKNRLLPLQIGEEGYTLYPGKLYLARTVEYTETHGLVPMLSGRSSIGRLGISVHVTAGFGDIGFKGTWTLEIHCIHPVTVYPNMEICQIYYQEPLGERVEYSGRYQGQMDATESRYWVGE